VANGVPQGSVLGPLLFLVYLNELPMILEPNGIPVLFADDASVLISHANPIHFKKTINAVYRTLDDWFKKNLLSLNTGKMQYINFIIKNNTLTERDMGDISSLITSFNDTKFLRLTIDSTLTWERHIKNVINKLCTACYMIRNIKPFMSVNTLKIVYYSYFHSVMNFGLIFWGNSPHAETVFRMQKRVIRLMKGCNYRESSRDFFKELKILPLKSQYMFSLMMFVTKNKDYFTVNKDCHCNCFIILLSKFKKKILNLLFKFVFIFCVLTLDCLRLMMADVSQNM
jgi:hypothetical protein